MLFITSTIASWEQKIHHRQKIFYISPGKILSMIIAGNKLD